MELFNFPPETATQFFSWNKKNLRPFFTKQKKEIMIFFLLEEICAFRNEKEPFSYQNFVRVQVRKFGFCETEYHLKFHSWWDIPALL